MSCCTSLVCNGTPSYQGDDYCDDENNNEGCQWDGGDCCGDIVNTQFCSACECLDPNGGGNGTTEPPTTEPPTEPPTNDCYQPNWVGDNYCDDGNNNEGCGWDGGDCCGNDVNTNFCSVCECLDPSHTTTTTTTEPPATESCQSPHWKGDNYCDDGNNNEGK